VVGFLFYSDELMISSFVFNRVKYIGLGVGKIGFMGYFFSF
jgi:hypothetical protein